MKKIFFLASSKDVIIEKFQQIREANSISIELNKQVKFRFVLVSDTIYSPFTPELFATEFKQHLQKNEPFINQVIDDPTLFRDDKLETALAVEVQDSKNGVVHVWSIEKFEYVQSLTHIFLSFTSYQRFILSVVVVVVVSFCFFFVCVLFTELDLRTCAVNCTTRSECRPCRRRTRDVARRP